MQDRHLVLNVYIIPAGPWSWALPCGFQSVAPLGVRSRRCGHMGHGLQGVGDDQTEG